MSSFSDTTTQLLVMAIKTLGGCIFKSFLPANASTKRQFFGCQPYICLLPFALAMFVENKHGGHRLMTGELKLHCQSLCVLDSSATATFEVLWLCSKQQALQKPERAQKIWRFWS